MLRGGYDRLYLCRVLHHEFFHIIDYRDDGDVYEDKAWAALNRPGFHYGTGGKNAQHVASARELTEKFPGFLNYYATTGVEEDKAEVFANLIVDPAYVAKPRQSGPRAGRESACDQECARQVLSRSRRGVLEQGRHGQTVVVKR